MKRHCLAALTLAGIILGQAAARADEGMWLIQDTILHWKRRCRIGD